MSVCWFVTLSQIYKSTKCNDMQQCGSCPRGPFCAFAHVESKSPQDISSQQPSHDSFCNLTFYFLILLFKTSSRALCSRGAFIPHTKLPSTPQTSRPSSCPGSFKSQQTQHGAWAWCWFCFRPLLPMCRIMCCRAGTAGKCSVPVWGWEWRSRAPVSLGRRGRVLQSAWVWERGSGEKAEKKRSDMSFMRCYEMKQGKSSLHKEACPAGFPVITLILFVFAG